jgi:FkbM family methyltransferase
MKRRNLSSVKAYFTLALICVILWWLYLLCNSLLHTEKKCPDLDLSQRISILSYFEFEKYGKLNLDLSSINVVTLDVGQSKSPLLPKAQYELVIGFEPNPIYWRENLQRFGNLSNLVSVPCAIGDYDGIGIFNQLNFMDSSSLLNVNREAVGNRLKVLKKNGWDIPMDIFEVQHKYFVAVFRLEKLIDNIPKNITIQYLKIDTQGNDMKVIEGCGNSIRRVHKIMMEATVTKQQFYEGASTKEEIVKRMESLGFALEKVQSQTGGDEENLYFRNDNFREKKL